MFNLIKIVIKMKKHFMYLMALAAVFAFVACTPDDEDSYTVKTLTFEGSTWDALIDTPQYGGKLRCHKLLQLERCYYPTSVIRLGQCLGKLLLLEWRSGYFQLHDD